MKITLVTLIVGSTLPIMLGGCSTKPVLPVAEPNPPVAAVQQDIAAYKDHPITWGGVILETNNGDEQSEIVIITKRLTASTRPIEGDQTLGRFLAKVNGFLDPAIFSAGREMTVHGIISGQDTRKVDDFDYTYPVVTVTEHYLWPERIEYYNDGYYDSFWYGPYYHSYPHHHSHRSIQSIKKH